MQLYSDTQILVPKPKEEESECLIEWRTQTHSLSTIKGVRTVRVSSSLYPLPFVRIINSNIHKI